MFMIEVLLVLMIRIIISICIISSLCRCHCSLILFFHTCLTCFCFDKIGESQELHEGDKVIFGHKNGYKVKVGETATQPDSEFQFVVSI